LTLHFPIDDASRVAEVRRRVAAIAREEGLSETASAQAEVVATEIATNLFKHAKQGEMHLASLFQCGRAGVEILSIDRGPGMASIDNCARDGVSSAGTPGTGLGAIMRLSHEFDAYSVPDKGTVLVSRIWASEKNPMGGWTVSAVAVPVRGEDVSGDNWAIHLEEDRASLMVADGLGHGVLAAEASQEAVTAFAGYATESPAVTLDQVHRRLRGTRGAAVAIARIEAGGRKLRYAGIGNICGVIGGGARMQSMVSHNGTAGHEARKLQEFNYDLPPEWTVIMHSDGINTSWNLDRYPGLIHKHPSVIAGVLYRDASRNRDDACVVVVRNARSR
jgi:anti-sigma regulatory factor (Ser/Thr protein kinase)